MEEVKVFLRSIFGVCIAAIVLNRAWSIFVDMFGVKGGYILTMK